MNFERFAKSYFGGDFAVAITDPFAMVLEKFRELRFGYAVMRCLEQLPNFFAASESSGIIAPRLMAKKIRFSGFLPCFVDLRRLTALPDREKGNTIYPVSRCTS